MKKTFKKLTALALSLVMVVSLSACGNAKKDPETTASKDPGSTTEDTTKTKDEVVTLKWVTVGKGMPANYDAWKAKINPYLEEKIGVNIEFEVVAWGDWDNRRSVVVNSNENYDILFTNLNTYTNDVNLGAFCDITDLLATEAPELNKFIPKNYWEATKVNGKIYAVPTYKDSSATQYFVWDTKLAEETGEDVTNLHDLASIDGVLRKINDKLGSPSFIMRQEGVTSIIGNTYDGMSAGLLPLGVKYDDESRTVVNTFEQKEVMEQYKLLHQWYKDGIINADAATLAETPTYRPFQIAQGWSGAAKTSWGPQMGVDAVAIQFGDSVLANDTVQGSMSCISASSKHPDKALQLLELVNTDSHVRDALYFGLEGDNFEYTADGKVHKINEDWEMAGYTQGTFFNVTQLDTEEFNQWEEVKTLNENAKPSVMLGFSIDKTPVEDQFTNCIEIYNRYKFELVTGVADPEVTVPAMMKELKSAGYDEIVAEVQKQIKDTFK